LQGLGLAAVLGAQGYQGCVGALSFSGEFVAVLVTQGGQLFAVVDAGLA
jgi:hypothetical protein